MPGIRSLEGPSRELMLRCDSCGEDDNFVQVVNYELNRVNGKLVHRHLIEAKVDHYFCEECGETVLPAYR